MIDQPLQTAPSLSESGGEYLRQMRSLNEVTISQLLEDRVELDRLLHNTRRQMIHRLGEMVTDIEQSYSQHQAMDRSTDYADRVRLIQEKIIQKLAAENASILVPLQSLWN